MSLIARAQSFSRHGLPALLLCAAAAMGSSGAWAQAARTWVSGVGDDANPCSRTAPCKTFAGAISKTAAAGGIDVLDPGGFGTVTVTKSIVIDGGNSAGGISMSPVTGVLINAGPGDTVVLRNLNIVGYGTSPALIGVRILQAGKVVLDNVKIQRATQAALKIDPSAATVVLVQNSQFIDNVTPDADDPGRAAIFVESANSVVHLSGTTVFGNDKAFSTVPGGKILSFNNNRFEGNTQDSKPTATVYER